MKTILLSLFFIYFAFNGISQTINYKKADSIALNFQKNKYYFYQETAQELTESFTTETEKCRAIFRWITNNIKYDFDVLKDYKKDCEDPMIVYKRKKAVCGGFSSLFKAMCDEAKIKCIYITGQAGCTDNCWHAWNIVKLDGVWYSMDITWASGHISGLVRNTKYTKQFDESYWMADYKLMAKDHWTDDSNWQEYIVPSSK